MHLFTFNFRKSYLNFLICLCFFLAVFLAYEVSIRKNPGNPMIIANNVLQKKFDLKKQDLIILGSSRALESIRPNFFVESFKDLSNVLNFSCHSCNLLENQIIPIVNEFNDKKNISKKMIVTVEPFLFRELNDIKSVNIDEGGLINNYLNKVNEKINFFGTKLIFSWCESCKPENRRQLHNWFGFFIFSIKDSIKAKFSFFSILKKNYNYWITHRANSFSTKIVHRDNGFEGMELVLNDKSVSIDEIFTKHQKFYKTHLANFDQTKIREVEKRLEDLKNKKMDIVLLRLPIHNSLISIENTFVPDFNKSMQELSKRLQIPYIDFNNSIIKGFTSDSKNFTDSSHLQFSATEKFNKVLIKELKKIWN